VRLRAELDARRLHVGEVASRRRTGAGSAADAEAFRDEVLDSLGVTDEQRQLWTGDWGFDPASDLTADQKLSNLLRFLSESTELIELLLSLTEGHESYQRGELGLALASYAKAESWFQRMLRTDLARSIDPTLPGGFPPRVRTWYEVARPRLGDRGFLDHLQIVFDVFHAQMLRPWDPDKARKVPEAEPFRKYLFYIRAFVLPLCLHDCYLELGNHCAAFAELLKIRHRTAYTEPLDAPKERTIGLGAGTFPAVQQAGLDPAGWSKFGEAYFHRIERRLLDIKAGRLMRDWGEFHERRAVPGNAGHPDTVAAKARYAQALRVHFPEWNAIKATPFTTTEAFRQRLRTALPEPINPLAIDSSIRANQGLGRLINGLNYVGYDPAHVPVWTYHFLLASARYFAEHARSLERDALSLLKNAEDELGNQRLLLQQIGTASSQLAVEGRRLAEAQASVEVAQAGVDLANIRRLNNRERQREWDTVGPTLQVLGVTGGAIGGAGSAASLSGGNPYAVAAGAVWGGVSSYISGNIEQQMHRNDLARQQQELDQGFDCGGPRHARRASGCIDASVCTIQLRIRDCQDFKR
jgi:hypothetical protein